MNDEIEKLGNFFKEAGKAHHQAFIEVDGFDPEWPIWYADYLFEKLPHVLGAELTKSELVYLLVHLSKIQPAEAPEEKWWIYYARYVIEHYL